VSRRRQPYIDESGGDDSPQRGRQRSAKLPFPDMTTSLLRYGRTAARRTVPSDVTLKDRVSLLADNRPRSQVIYCHLLPT
jgi:hypothetical protein